MIRETKHYENLQKGKTKKYSLANTILYNALKTDYIAKVI